MKIFGLKKSENNRNLALVKKIHINDIELITEKEARLRCFYFTSLTRKFLLFFLSNNFRELYLSRKSFHLKIFTKILRKKNGANWRSLINYLYVNKFIIITLCHRHKDIVWILATHMLLFFFRFLSWYLLLSARENYVLNSVISIGTMNVHICSHSTLVMQ